MHAKDGGSLISQKARVQECRLKAGIKSQKQLAYKSGISRSVICDLENGRCFLSSKNALKIANAIGCSMDDLFGRG